MTFKYYLVAVLVFLLIIPGCLEAQDPIVGQFGVRVDDNIIWIMDFKVDYSYTAITVMENPDESVAVFAYSGSWEMVSPDHYVVSGTRYYLNLSPAGEIRNLKEPFSDRVVYHDDTVRRPDQLALTRGEVLDMVELDLAFIDVKTPFLYDVDQTWIKAARLRFLDILHDKQ